MSSSIPVGGVPGQLTPFDIGASTTGLGQSLEAMTNRYGQLGLGGNNATPTSPGSFGLGSTAMGMDLGALPSVTGGIPAEFTAEQGQAQTANLANSIQLALSNLKTGTSTKGSLLGEINNLLGG